MIEDGMTPQDVSRILYTESGLLGLSGISRNMQELLASDAAGAAEPVDYFCHHTRRHLAGLTASLGGLDRLVFTGGIGANSWQVRSAICEGLEYLGISLDRGANARGATVISASGGRVVVEARQTDEEAMIAGHVCAMLSRSRTEKSGV